MKKNRLLITIEAYNLAKVWRLFMKQNINILSMSFGRINNHVDEQKAATDWLEAVCMMFPFK